MWAASPHRATGEPDSVSTREATRAGPAARVGRHAVDRGDRFDQVGVHQAFRPIAVVVDARS